MQMRLRMKWRDTASGRSSSLRNRMMTGLMIAQDPEGRELLDFGSVWLMQS